MQLLCAYHLYSSSNFPSNNFITLIYWSSPPETTQVISLSFITLIQLTPKSWAVRAAYSSSKELSTEWTLIIPFENPTKQFWSELYIERTHALYLSMLYSFIVWSHRIKWPELAPRTTYESIIAHAITLKSYASSCTSFRPLFWFG